MLLVIYFNQSDDKMGGCLIISQYLKNGTTKTIKLLPSFVILEFHPSNFNLDLSRLLKKSGIYLLSDTPLLMSFIGFGFMSVLSHMHQKPESMTKQCSQHVSVSILCVNWWYSAENS